MILVRPNQMVIPNSIDTDTLNVSISVYVNDLMNVLDKDQVSIAVKVE